MVQIGVDQSDSSISSVILFTSNLLWREDVVSMLSNVVARRRVVRHHDNLAAFLCQTHSNLRASLPHHLGEMPSDRSVTAWLSSEGVVLDLRVPTINSSLCLLLSCPSTGHVEVLSILVGMPMLEAVHCHQIICPFLCHIVELVVEFEGWHAMFGSVRVVGSQRVLPKFVEVNWCNVDLLGAFTSRNTTPGPCHACSWRKAATNSLLWQDRTCSQNHQACAQNRQKHLLVFEGVLPGVRQENTLCN